MAHQEEPQNEVASALARLDKTAINPLGAICNFSTEDLKRLSAYAQSVLSPGQKMEQTFLRQGDLYLEDDLRKPITDALKNDDVDFGFQGQSSIETAIREKVSAQGVALEEKPLTFCVVLWKKRKTA